jgi:hypothetical protein
MNSMIYDAIQEMRLIRFDYDGLTRLVEPCAYGTTSKGNEVLRAYQVSGFSNSGVNEGWKLFTVAKVENLGTEVTVFSKRPDFRSGDSAIANMYCEISG